MSTYSILINKEHPLDAAYIPEQLTEPSIPFYAPPGDSRRLLQKAAAQAAEELFKRAKDNKIHLHGISGYRPYKRQEELYLAAKERILKEHSTSGPAPVIAVAPPGTSEHQTGLALDVSCTSVSYELEESFAHTREGKWLHANASLYGFILRYPKGRENITGFPYEPWHIRYVGEPLSLYLTMTGMTLEEYDKI